MNTNIAFASPLNAHAVRKLKIARWEDDVHGLSSFVRKESNSPMNCARRSIKRSDESVSMLRVLCGHAYICTKSAPSPSPHQFRVRVHYELPGNDLFAEHTAHDPVAALDLVAEKIERRLRKRKTARLARRLREHRANPDRWGIFATRLILPEMNCWSKRRKKNHV